jgi:hypothetical protein
MKEKIKNMGCKNKINCTTEKLSIQEVSAYKDHRQ